MSNIQEIEKNMGVESIALKVDVIQDQLKFLQGRVLTIVEATLPDGKQKKATKDLVNKEFSDQLSYVWQLCFPDTHFLTSDQAENTLDMPDAFEKSKSPSKED